MNKTIVAGFALSVAAASLLTTPAAQAGVPVAGPEGFFCGFAASTDPNPAATASAMVGMIYAGPATVPPAAGGTMSCRITIGVGTHTSPHSASASFSADSNGIILGAETTSYNRSEGTPTYMCTSYQWPNGSIIYWTPGAGSIPSRWHTDPSKACSEATSAGTQDVWDIVDGQFCPKFAVDNGWHAQGNGYFDKEGDVFIDFDGDGISENYPAPAPQDSQHAMNDLFYDCPTYTSTLLADENPDRDVSHYGSQTAPSVIDW